MSLLPTRWLLLAALSLGACRPPPRRVEATHRATAHDAAPPAAAVDAVVATDTRPTVEDVGVAAAADAAAPADPEPPVSLSRFDGLRRDRVIDDPVVVLELLQNYVYWVPMSDGACARLRMHPDERGNSAVTAGGYTAGVVVWASTHRRGQPAEFTIHDPQHRLFDGFPAGDRGVLMFLVGREHGIRYRLTWDGTSLAVTTSNSIQGNAVVRLHPERRTCLPEAEVFRASGIAP